MRVIFVFQTDRPISHLRTKSPSISNRLMVYKFKCGDSNVTYIRKTKRHLGVRMSEHLGISLKTNKKFKYNKAHATAIRSRSFECQHSASFEDFNLIGAARNDFQLLIKESILIARDLPLLCKKLPARIILTLVHSHSLFHCHTVLSFIVLFFTLFTIYYICLIYLILVNYYVIMLFL